MRHGTIRSLTLACAGALALAGAAAAQPSPDAAADKAEQQRIDRRFQDLERQVHRLQSIITQARDTGQPGAGARGHRSRSRPRRAADPARRHGAGGAHPQRPDRHPDPRPGDGPEGRRRRPRPGQGPERPKSTAWRPRSRP
ncbi:MAG: hypothetical protein WDM92_10990 [Caulobacteraceae bacterium]